MTDFSKVKHSGLQVLSKQQTNSTTKLLAKFINLKAPHITLPSISCSNDPLQAKTLDVQPQKKKNNNNEISQMYVEVSMPVLTRILLSAIVVICCQKGRVHICDRLLCPPVRPSVYTLISPSVRYHIKNIVSRSCLWHCSSDFDHTFHTHAFTSLKLITCLTTNLGSTDVLRRIVFIKE